MTRRPWLIAALFTAAACTPFGVWLYEEPSVVLDDVLLDTSPAEVATAPYVVLAVKNRNDFELSLRRIELVLLIDGQGVGSIDMDTVVSLAPIAVRPVRIQVPPTDAAAASRIAAVRSGSHRYEVQGRARLETPIGERRIGFKHSIRGEAEPTAR